jgi:tetratricopeptide (TPR) repeat protein
MITADIMPQLQRAQAMLQAGQAAQAWLLLAPMRQAIDRHGQALRLYALVAQAAGRIDDADSALKRILELEGTPPEILGGLADMLEKAGRHAEALVHWDRLVALRPDLVDAHLNRAVTAANAGAHDLAVAAAEAGLARFPGHSRLLATKAQALKNAGRVEESLRVFDQAVAADPARALTRHNQAVALRAYCRFDESCEAYSEAERLGMQGPQFHANWAAAALEAGKVGEAAALYRKALREDPAHQESLKALTRLQIEYRGGQDAFAHYQQSLEARGHSTEAWLDWANALLANYRYEEAAAVAEDAARQCPEDPSFVALAAYAVGMLGDAAAALDRIEDAYRARDDAPVHWLTQLALRAKRPERAAELAEAVTAAQPENQFAWSILSIAWRLLDDPREHWLCDYETLVMSTEVASLDGSLSPADYARNVAAALDPLHQTGAEPGDQSLRGGTQTSGRLFDRPEPAIQEFREAVRMAAQRAVAALPDDPQHPFLRRKSDNVDFAGSWSVRLRGGGGYHVPHFHIQGWMSSAYYARLPTMTDESRIRHEGWIQFGAPPHGYGLELPPRRVVEPAPGRLVLFPSYMWHGTIPFEEGDRLTAAFDYLPL